MSDYPSPHLKPAPKFIQIAPASDRKLILTPEEPRKYNYKSNPQSTSIARRNARERNRVKQVNDSFNALRKKLPAAVIAALAGGSRRGSGKKLSKVDTLRMVVEYIRYLENIVEETDDYSGDIARKTNPMETSYSETFQENFDGDRTSPFSCSVASPLGSESSSGVSSSFSSEQQYLCNGVYQFDHQTSAPQDDLFSAMTWWDEK